MRYLLDTNVVSETSRPQPEPRVLDWLERTPLADTFLSVLTLGELERGILAAPDPVRRSRLQVWYDTDLRPLYAGRILDVTPPVVSHWAILVQRGRAKGQTPPTLDSLIAATALAHGLTVVTRNAADFAPLGVPVLNIWEG